MQMADDAEARLAKTNMEKLARDQLTASYKFVNPLKDSEFHKFKEQIERVAWGDDWPPEILDVNTPWPEDHDPTNRTNMQFYQERNAYLLIVNKSDDHQVAKLLKACPRGDAKGAWKIVHEYFYSCNLIGRNNAMKRYYNATQANTNSDITSWIAEVQQRAQMLHESGGREPDETTTVSILLNGLLPEFKVMKQQLEHADPDRISMPIVVRKLLDFAQIEGLMHLTKDSKQPNTRNNTFSLQESSPGVQHPRREKKNRTSSVGTGHKAGVILAPSADFFTTAQGHVFPTYPEHQPASIRPKVPPASQTW